METTAETAAAVKAAAAKAKEAARIRSQGGRDGRFWTAGQKSVEQTKSVGSLGVFSESAAGALPAIWAKLPQSLVLEGEKKGWKE